MIKPITKAVFPVAGLGTRFLPATKASPKEMLPIVDRPLIQYAVDEAVEAGITNLIFITGRTKNSIMDHFDKAYELETELAARGNERLLELARSVVPDGITCTYIRQPEARGLGDAVLCARPVVGDEPFAVILADDLVANPGRGCMAQLVEQYGKTGCSILATEEVPREATHRYGIVATDTGNGRLSEIRGIVEKPAPEKAPSNLAVIGRYVLTPRVFARLATTERGTGNEIQLTDAIAGLLATERVFAYRFEGRRYDCGDKLGYLKATVEFALNHAELGEPFREYLQSLGETTP
ncbi:MAG: UTP--glucose-1-phosphate uridylyltransferase GalU [Chromatiales bacterium]|nr:UTP--glucose-1-phosphate uridylyltransferase GalU [Chromatiales bacterium]